MDNWAIQSKGGRFVVVACNTFESTAWSLFQRACLNDSDWHEFVAVSKDEGYRAVRVEVREIEDEQT